MANVAFRNQSTGEVKSVKVGWSWTLFFFGPILGIPLWMRKVYPYAALMVAWNALCVLIPDSAGSLDTLMRGAGIGISIVLGQQGNKLTAEYYLKHGWELAEPEADAALYAKEKWALA